MPGDTGASVVCASTHVVWRGRNLNDEQLAKLCSTQLSIMGIRSLDLSENNIEGPGLEQVGNRLKEAVDLRVLRLGDNKVDTGIEHLLPLLDSLSELDLSYNQVSVEGVGVLVEHVSGTGALVDTILPAEKFLPPPLSLSSLSRSLDLSIPVNKQLFILLGLTPGLPESAMCCHCLPLVESHDARCERSHQFAGAQSQGKSDRGRRGALAGGGPTQQQNHHSS